MGRGMALPGATKVRLVPATKDSSQMTQPVVRCPKAPGRGRAAWEATPPATRRCHSQQDGIAKGASVLCSCWGSF